jgi:hypothetical protein
MPGIGSPTDSSLRGRPAQVCAMVGEHSVMP